MVHTVISLCVFPGGSSKTSIWILVICPGSRDGKDAALASQCGAISSDMLLLCLETYLCGVASPLAARIIQFWGKAVIGNVVK